MGESAIPAPTPTSPDYMLESANERDRMYILFDLWRPLLMRSRQDQVPTGGMPSLPTLHFRVPSQLQSALPEEVPFIRPPVRRPFQYWVTR